MAVPNKKKSRSRTRMHRAANMKYDGVQVQSCPACSEPVVPHRACPSCGVYRGRQVLVKAEL